MIALGVMAHKDEFGMEASGVVRRCGRNVKDLQPGDRLMVCKPGLFRTRTVVSRDRCNRSPDSLSFEDAASMPVVYSTAYYCLIEIGRLEKGQVRGNMTSIECVLSKLTSTVYPNSRGLWWSRVSGHAAEPNGWSKRKYRQIISLPGWRY